MAPQSREDDPKAQAEQKAAGGCLGGVLSLNVCDGHPYIPPELWAKRGEVREPDVETGESAS
jgi:hypothetical protein